jgi:hypothetical protein
MTPSLGPARAFDLAHRDLAAIAARLEPMHDAAWWPAQPDHDRPTPNRPPTVDPDFVAGSMWDCGQGDERVRQGWTRMVCHLWRADETATVVLRAGLCVTRDAPVVVYRPTSLLDAQLGVKRLQARHKALERLWERWTVDDVSRARWLADALMKGPTGHEDGSCCDDIKHAMYEAQRAIPIVGNGKPPATCTQCRRLGSIGQPRIGGVCFACDKRNQRAGVPRRTTVVVRQRRATLRAQRR